VGMTRRRVLVIDDEPDVREMLREYVEMLGHEVLEGANGLEALWAVKHHHPEVVFLDLAMPRLGGLDAIKYIRKFDPGIRIMVVSGYASNEIEVSLRQLGIPVLHKPIELSSLADFLGVTPS
jgi:two-component system response regulator (stage 0 sporulation protein F)